MIKLWNTDWTPYWIDASIMKMTCLSWKAKHFLSKVTIFSGKRKNQEADQERDFVTEVGQGTDSEVEVGHVIKKEEEVDLTAVTGNIEGHVAETDIKTRRETETINMKNYL